ncbi:DUF6069 family protein [Streptomonospora sp. S1-112]|uniref:DUF6069 family protein n=1 Tax=Streptomonospora mangrovi TaxID=2883123 RepID=A0A9X3SGL8_9ACTN|nr:DUF6069 family protein [Streptomonospora mangrovi]MDA0564314.1 DUF6069 family protein [Streptomonospora mangrovi]
MSEFGSERRVNVARLWSGGLATAVVAALIILVGALVVRGVLGVPVLAPEDAGYFGDLGTALYALMAACAALAATALLHLLLLSAPRPTTFFGWIVGLAAVVAAVTPFTQDAPFAGQLSTALINAVTGTAIASLLSGVGAAAVRRPRPRRSLRGRRGVPGGALAAESGTADVLDPEIDPATGTGVGYAAGYRDALAEHPDRRYDGRHRSGDDPRTAPEPRPTGAADPE